MRTVGVGTEAVSGFQLMFQLASGCELYMYNMLRARLRGAWVLSVCGCGTRVL